MHPSLRTIQRQLLIVSRMLDARGPTSDIDRFSKYARDPRGYCRDVLRCDVTPDQEELMMGLITPPYRVHGRAGHTVGKSRAAAMATSWIYDTRDPCMILTTAPTERSVRNIIWRELHSMRAAAGLGGFKTSASLMMKSSANHYALGMTAANTLSFHGQHELRCYIILDEATGIETEFWDASDSMLNGEEHGLMAIYNPFSTATKAWEEEQKGESRCKVVTMSCLDHPNITAELQGLPAIYPSAVRLEWVNNAVKEWSDVIPEEDADPAKGDFMWPPREVSIRQTARDIREIADAPPVKVPVSPEILAANPPRWYRPGALCNIRVLGQWPREGIDTVWNEVLFQRCRDNHLEVQPHWRTAIGCDVARFGDDMTVICVRRGPCVVHIEEHSGWDTAKTTARLKSLCYEYRGPEDEHRVRVFVDEPGMGAGVLDHAEGWNFIGVNPASKSGAGAGTVELLNVSRRTVEFQFANVRTQLWFDTREMARKAEDGYPLGMVDLSRLPKEQAQELKRQLMAQTFGYRKTDGAVFCTEKDEVKEIIKRSPDTADALNLAYCRMSPVRDTFSVMR